MHDSLATAADSIQGDAITLAIALQSAEHFLRQGIGERSGLIDRGNDVVNGGYGAFWTANTKPLLFKSSKRLGARDLMD